MPLPYLLTVELKLRCIHYFHLIPFFYLGILKNKINLTSFKMQIIHKLFTFSKKKVALWKKKIWHFVFKRLFCKKNWQKDMIRL
jgi:hypothetical protein